MSLWTRMPQIDRKDSRPLYSQLSALLTKHIQQHQFPPGTPIPTENELMAQFGVSRTTVRQAIQQLESSGLVTKSQGKGTFVAAPKDRSQVRFFSSIERWLAKQGQLVKNQLLANTTGPPTDWALDLGYPPEGPARIIRRLKLLDERPLALEHRVLPPDIAALLNDDDINNSAFYNILDSFPESQLEKVLYCLTATSATGEEAELLKALDGSPLMVRTGIYHNQAGRPFMAARVVFVAERIDLRLEFHREEAYWGIRSVP